MGMKNRLIALSYTTAALAGQSYSGRGTVSKKNSQFPTDKWKREDLKNSKPLSNSYFKPEIPKGHKIAELEFQYEREGFLISISLPVTFANEKSLQKRANSLYKDVAEYLYKTPINKLIEFNQFTITKKETSNDNSESNSGQ